MAALSLGKVFAEIEMQDRFTQAIMNASAHLGTFKRNVEDAGRPVDHLGGRVEHLGRSSDMTGHVIRGSLWAALTGIGTAATAGAVSVDQAYSNIVRGTGATGEALAGLKRDFSAVFSGVPESAQVVGTAIADVNTRLDLTGTALQDATRLFLDFARINREDVSGSIRVVSQVINSMKMDASELPGVLDKLTAASQASGIGVNQLAQYIIDAGPAFQEMGYGLDESIALFAQFEKAGAKPSELVNNLNRTLMQFAKEGVTDAREAYTLLLERIAAAPNVIEGVNIANMAFGRATSRVVEDIQAGRFELGKWMDVIQESGGRVRATTEESRTWNETLSIMRNRFVDATSAAGPMLTAVGSLGPLAMTVHEFARALTAAGIAQTGFAASSTKLIGVLTGPLGLIAALGGLAVAWTYLRTQDIREQARVYEEAAEILGRSANNIQEAREAIAAAAQARAGQTVTGPLTLDAARTLLGELPPQDQEFVVNISTPGMRQATEDTNKLRREIDEARAAVQGLSSAKRDDLVAAIRTGHHSMQDLRQAYGLSEMAIKLLTDQVKGHAAEVKKADSWITSFRDSAVKLESQLATAARAGVPMSIMLDEFGSQISTIVTRAPMIGHAIGSATQDAADALQQAELDKVIDRMMAEAAKNASSHVDQIVAEQSRIAEAAQERANTAFLFGLNEQAALWKEQGELRKRVEGETLERAIANMRHEFAMRRIGLDERREDHRQMLLILQQNEELAIRALTEEWQGHYAKLRAEANSYVNILKDALHSIPGLIQKALTGGGGLMGGVQAIVSGLGAGLGGRAFEDLAARMSNTLFRAFGASATAALGTIIPGIGAALGALAGPMLDKLTSALGGLFNRNKGRDLVRDFASGFEGGFDGLQRQLMELGYHGEQLWIRLTQGVGRNNPREAQAAIDAVTLALEAHKQTMLDVQDAVSAFYQRIDRAADAAQRWGLEWDQLGEALQRRDIGKFAEDIMRDWEDLAWVGADLNQVAIKMADSVNEWFEKAMRAGLEIPRGMQPVLQKMIDLGLLTGENGELLDHLGDVQWADNLTSAADRIVEAMEKVGQAIRDALAPLYEAYGLRMPDIPTPSQSPQPTPTPQSNGPSGFGPGSVIQNRVYLDGRQIGQSVTPVVADEMELHGIVR